jgi:two-component system sensor histidine kinase RegB
MAYVPRHRIQRIGASRLRLQTIVRLRWIAVVGQLVAVLAVHWGLGFPLPIGGCLFIIALSAWVNIFLRIRYAARHRLSTLHATVLLCYDVLQLAALLYMTGGIQNPFAFLLLVPVTVSAAMLSMTATLVVAGVALAVAGTLTFLYLPFPWRAGDPLDLPLLYRLGVLAAIFCGITFMGLYARRLAKETTQMSDALAATEHVLAHEQQLHALDGLAAAAAHELGTPLGTITLVAKELVREVPAGSPIAEDIALIQSQAQRCREILGTLTERGVAGDPLHEHLPLSHLIEEAVEPFQVLDKHVTVDVSPLEAAPEEARPEPVAVRQPGVVYGLTNIIENAADFAEQRVEVSARWDSERVVVTIADDGAGFPPNVIDRLGDPYVTSRPLGDRQRQGKGGGLGLGFFIAKTLLERSGAELQLANRDPPAHGAIVEISWPRAAFEGDPSDEREAEEMAA